MGGGGVVMWLEGRDGGGRVRVRRGHHRGRFGVTQVAAQRMFHLYTGLVIIELETFGGTLLVSL